MRRLKIAAHVDVETLEKRYRDCHERIDRSYWQILWLLASGLPSEAVTRVTDYSVKRIRLLTLRYNAEGEAAVGDQRHHNLGAKPKLNADDTHPFGAHRQFGGDLASLYFLRQKDAHQQVYQVRETTITFLRQ
jgi:hypothetical protein